jgi:mannose-6-phosphate isomerase
MKLNFPDKTDKELIFNNVTEYLTGLNIKIDKKDDTRPWGGFYVIDESWLLYTSDAADEVVKG